MSFCCKLFWIWWPLFLHGGFLAFQDMIKLHFSLRKSISLPQTACSNALLSLCQKDFLIPTQSTSSSGQACGCLSYSQWTGGSQPRSFQAEDDWGLQCLGKVFFICLPCLLTSPPLQCCQEMWCWEARFWSDAVQIFLGHKIQFIAFLFRTAFSVLEECY